MALSVVFNGTTLFEGLSGEAGDWSGTDGISTEVYQQGASSEGWIVAKNGDETAIYDYYAANGNSAADMSATDTHLYIHMRCDIAPFIDYLWIGLSSTSAGTTNYEDWQVVDNTTAIEWYGEWKTFIVDINADAGRSNGTLTLSDVRSIRINVDNSNSGNIRSIENTYLDVGRFGTGITAYESTTTAFDLADIEAIANNGTNKFGVIESIGGVNFVRGRIVIGDSAGTNYANFTSTDETVVFLDSSVSGESISTGLYQFNFVGNSTNPTAVSVGTKVGTGDAATGRNGTTVQGETSVVEVSMSCDENVTMDVFGLTLRQLGGLVSFDDLDSGDEFAGCTFDGCDQVTLGGAVTRNVTFLNTVAAATSGALLWQMDIPESDATTPAAGDTGLGAAPSTFSIVSSVTFFGTYSSAVTNAWLRFHTIDIPQGAVIESAVVSVFNSISESGSAFTVDAYGVDEDDHAAPNTYSEWSTDHSNHTTATTQYTHPVTNSVYVPVDVTSIVQELIDRTGWVSGNDIGIHLDPQSTGAVNNRVTLDFNTGHEATLEIAYNIGDVEYCLFVNNAVAVEIQDLGDDTIFEGMEFQGNTQDVRYEGADSYDLNVVGGDTPSIQNAGAGTLTAVSSKLAAFTPIDNGSAFTITKNSDNSVLLDVASTTGGEVVYSYDGTLDSTATTVHIIIAGKEPIDFPWTIAEGTVPVSQVTDRIYSNP